MNNRRIFIGLQHFAEGEGDGGADANVPGNQTADNGGDAQDNASQKPTFDDMLKDKDMQSEFDKRVSKAEDKKDDKPEEKADKPESEPAPAVPDAKDEEILRLKTSISVLQDRFNGIIYIADNDGIEHIR